MTDKEQLTVISEYQIDPNAKLSEEAKQRILELLDKLKTEEPRYLNACGTGPSPKEEEEVKRLLEEFNTIQRKYKEKK